MVSTPTTRLRLEKQGLGDNSGSWGYPKLNDVIDRMDEAVAGVQAITISGASTTLTSTNYSTDQARKPVLVLSGTLSANSTITVPSVEKLYLVVNGTTQSTYSLTIKTAAGTGYALRGGSQWVYCDGSDVARGEARLDQVPLPTATVDLNSQLITGLATPAGNTDAATKAYVDAAVAGGSTSAVSLSSGAITPSLGTYFYRTITGAQSITIAAAPTAVYEFWLELYSISGSVTWPVSVYWPGGTAPTLTTSKMHLIKLVTRDTGTKWRGMYWSDYQL